jgi:hypothetical protein
VTDPPVADPLVVVDMQEYFCRPDSALARWVDALGGIAADGWYHARLTDTVVRPSPGQMPPLVMAAVMSRMPRAMTSASTTHVTRRCRQAAASLRSAMAGTTRCRL